MYLLKHTLLRRMNDDQPWANVSTAESDFYSNTMKEARLAMVRDVQHQFRDALKNYGIGNVFYQKTDDNWLKRELIIHDNGVQILQRVEIKQVFPDEMRDCPHFDMGR